MKQLAGLIAAVGVAFATIPATAAEWVLVDKTPDGSTAYIDRASIRRAGQYTWFWLSLMAPKDFKGPNIGAVSLYISADCNSRQARLRQLTVYDTSQNIVFAESPGDQGPIDRVPSNAKAINEALRQACSR